MNRIDLFTRICIALTTISIVLSMFVVRTHEDDRGATINGYAAITCFLLSVLVNILFIAHSILSDRRRSLHDICNSA